MPPKKVITLYLNPIAATTQLLTQFIAKHIKQINETHEIVTVKVTADNTPTLRNKGITRTPTMIYNGKMIIDINQMKAILTPASRAKETFGVGNTSPEELLDMYNRSILHSDPNEDEDNGALNFDKVREGMIAMQKRRPVMDNDKHNTGGYKLPVKPAKKQPVFTDDDSFMAVSGVDNISQTPVSKYGDEYSGESILEDYFNDEANQMGRKIVSRMLKT